MNVLLPSFGILQWMFLGIGAAILGLLALLVGPMLPKKAARYVGLTVLVLLGMMAVACYLTHEQDGAVVFGVFTLLWTCGVILQSNLFRRVSHISLDWVGYSRLQAVVLLALAPAAFGVGVYAEQAETNAIPGFDIPLDQTLKLTEVASQVSTDEGTAIAVFLSAELQDARATEKEREFLDRPLMRERVIRTGPAGVDTNCHGWVFTAGQYWIKGEAVARILDENGYEEVSSPNVDDIVVYRDEVGLVTHTALVRLVSSRDSLILLESKWGQYGRFIHSPVDQPYGSSFKYYRTARNGHTLRGIDKGYKPGTPAHTG